MNKIVDRSRLTPALVPPVAAVSGKHLGEVAHSCYTRSGERCAGIGVAPGTTAIGGFKDQVRVVVRETTAAFVHPRNVYGPAARQVARDLHVADKGSLGAYHRRAAPSRASISRRNDKDVRVGLIKVVPGNVHPPEERRAGIVIHPARLAVVTTVIVNAEMGPTIRMRGRGGLVPAKTLTTARPIQPHREPGPT